jgi:hypothetical protein
MLCEHGSNFCVSSVMLQVHSLFQQLGLHNVALSIAKESISPLFCPSSEPATLQQWASETSVSAATFFENKYGILCLNVLLLM